jgi:hypothetical protein
MLSEQHLFQSLVEHFITNWMTQLASCEPDLTYFTTMIFCKTDAFIISKLEMLIEQDLYMFLFQAYGGNSSVSGSFSTSNFVGSANNYGNQIQEQNLESSSVTAQCPTQTLPSRPKTQRPRVPPPSKVSIKHVCTYLLTGWCALDSYG